ncbi:hypothetical protein SZN_09511 [Streptomyces zinciresistens K42]|uniref:Uncharacterized protein n=1 Tax=Streptomyces zinciresistens K42 TaxID=700597 RepID=G2G8T4_9ACTN|nr:hypothetical protein [Streptomyces zinciresistens]EGX60149.1 hypothetical protein SZN_09511 [Streptomyces zinciresistens K42]
MEQSTQPTTTAAPPGPPPLDAIRASYQRARALADRIVGLGQVIPTSVETYRYLGADHFAVRIHFGTGLEAGRGLLTAAAHIDAQPTRDDERAHARWGGVVWIEAQTTADGVQVVARALLNTTDADQLLPRSDTPPSPQAPAAAEPTPPTPAASTDPAGVVVPAITPVVPLATAHTPETGA